MNKTEAIARMKYNLKDAYESRCDCCDVDQKATDDLTILINKLESKIREMEAAA